VWQWGLTSVSVTLKVRPECVKEVAVRESPWMMDERGWGWFVMGGR
jgi:hypothetical protein